MANHLSTGASRALGWLQICGQAFVFVYSLIIGPLTGAWSLGTGVLLVVASAALLTAAYRPEALRPIIWPAAVLAFVGGVVWAPAYAKSIGFYETTAQIVPVLFVVLAVELGAFRPGRQLTNEDRRAAMITSAALILAGFECLQALAANSVKAGDFNLVVGALAASAAALFGLVVTEPASANQPAPDERPPLPTRPSAYDVIIAALLLCVGRRKRRDPRL